MKKRVSAKTEITPRFKGRIWICRTVSCLLAASALLPAVHANDRNAPTGASATRQDQAKTVPAINFIDNLDQAQSSTPGIVPVRMNPPVPHPPGANPAPKPAAEPPGQHRLGPLNILINRRVRVEAWDWCPPTPGQ